MNRRQLLSMFGSLVLARPFFAIAASNSGAASTMALLNKSNYA
jgi:hypothetical protein